jgi:hypothetical protein
VSLEKGQKTHSNQEKVEVGKAYSQVGHPPKSCNEANDQKQ